MRRIRSFVRERYLEIVLLYGAVQLGFIAIGGWLDRRRWIAGLASLGIIASLPLIFGYLDRRARRRHVRLAAEEAFSVPRRALVITLGLPPYDQSVVPLVMEHLRDIAFVGLIATPEVYDRSLPSYEAALRAAGKTVRVGGCDGKSLSDIVRATDGLLSWLLEECEVPPEHVVVDLTHGTTLLSLGAFIESEEREIECEYIYSEYDDSRRPKAGTQRPIIAVIPTWPPATRPSPSTWPRCHASPRFGTIGPGQKPLLRPRGRGATSGDEGMETTVWSPDKGQLVLGSEQRGDEGMETP